MTLSSAVRAAHYDFGRYSGKQERDGLVAALKESRAVVVALINHPEIQLGDMIRAAAIQGRIDAALAAAGEKP